MSNRPFPYDRFPKLTRQQIAVFGAVAAAWDGPSSTRALLAARELLGRELAWHAGQGEWCNAQQIAARIAGSETALALRIEASAAALPPAVLIELPNETARGLVDRALGGEGTAALPHAIVPLDELSRGALAYVVARVLAALGGGLRLCDLKPLAAGGAWLEAGAYAVWPLTITLGALSLPLRAYVPERLAVSVPVRERAVSRELDQLPLTLVADAGSATLPLTAAKTLAPNDVLVLDRSSLVRDGSRYRGSVIARLPGSSSQLLCRACDAGLEIEAFSRMKEPSMTTGRLQEPSTPGASEPNFAADAPIELSIEIARFSLTLGELQRLQAGDVLQTGRRIGEHVTVRMAGRAFAEGELVDVEGEVGVRLLKFLAEP